MKKYKFDKKKQTQALTILTGNNLILPFKLSQVSVTQLFKSFEFGNGSRMSDENFVLLEFKYLQNKKW